MKRVLWLALLAITPSTQASPADASERGPEAFRQWAASRPAEVAAFEAYLQAEGVADVVPAWQLLRTASDWHQCKAEPFALAPRAQWQAAAHTLSLLKTLRERRLLGDFEVASSWRGEALNRCAQGAASSAHVRSFATDILPGSSVDGLCQFWKEHGRAWNMGLSRYPSGRVHLDTAGYRTWGSDYTRGSSFCQ